MKRLINSALSVLFVLLAAACTVDEGLVPSPSPDETDVYIGEVKNFQLGPQTETFSSQEFVCRIMAPDGSVIYRGGVHSRRNGLSSFEFANGLKDGIYRLLALEYEVSVSGTRFVKADFGLGCRMEVKDGRAVIVDSYDEVMGMFGKGTQDNPFIISSDTHLTLLRKLVNDEETNKLFHSQLYFRQVAPIDMEYACYMCHKEYYWLPIGNNVNTPFRGVYYGDEIINLKSLRPNSPGVGLFGYVQESTIDGIVMRNAEIEGVFACGTVVGGVITAGDVRNSSIINNCIAVSSSVKGSENSLAMGGIVGGVDVRALALITGCENVGSKVRATYNAGGILGAAGIYSNVSINNCVNSGEVESDYSGAGGIVGTADTLYVSGCVNNSIVKGALRYDSSDTENAGLGAGGIAGGSGVSFITACRNTADIAGYDGVGGIVGSSRVGGGDNQAYVYNNVMLRHCANTGTVKGRTAVGGLCGEAQFGCYGSYNSGKVEGKDYVAGIVGCTSIAVVHNALNSAEVVGRDYVSGIVGKTVLGSIAFDHNYGKISGSGTHTAGVVALAGNNTVINSCGNFADIQNTSHGAVGGIVGEIGDPREWTAMNIAECVIGSIEIVLGLAGPVLAVAEEFATKGLKILLKVAELTPDVILKVTDASLLGYGIYEHHTPEEVEKIKVGISEAVTGMCEEVKAEMTALRLGSRHWDLNGFSSENLSAHYTSYVHENLDFYEASEDNVSLINKKINSIRDERYDHVVEHHRTEEMVHNIIAGVALITGTIVSVAGIFATGGLAVPVVLAGSVVSVVGGLNAISKNVHDFETNAVIISQCVNAGDILATDGSEEDVGGIVGVLQDNGLMRDCLNTGNGPGMDFYCGHLAGTAGGGVEMNNCLTIAAFESYRSLISDMYGSLFGSIYLNNIYFWTELSPYDLAYYDYMYSISGIEPLKRDVISNPDSYKGWNIGGEDSIWTIPSTPESYPVPARSELR